MRRLRLRDPQELQRVALEAYIRRLGLRYFEPWEVIQPCAYALPPRVLWPNIVLPLRVWDEVRHRCGFPILLTSTYRDPQKNEDEDGAPLSQHLIFGAADGQPVDPTLEKVRRMYEVALELLGELFEVPRKWEMQPASVMPNLHGLDVPQRTTLVWDPREPEAPTLARWLGFVFIYEDEDDLFMHIDARAFVRRMHRQLVRKAYRGQ